MLFAARAHAVQPTVNSSYSPALDSVCALVRGGEIRDEWKSELLARQSEFDALWAGAGPAMIDAAQSITGKPFPPEPVTARLTLCNIPSQSIVGISVNMRYALRSFTQAPVSMRYKVDTLFHELLHVYVVRFPIRESALLAAQGRESQCTRNHLHLLALQKAVLLKLQQADALRDVVAIDAADCYRRAWAIVNATETEYLKYVAELSK